MTAQTKERDQASIQEFVSDYYGKQLGWDDFDWPVALIVPLERLLVMSRGMDFTSWQIIYIAFLYDFL